MTLEEQIKQLVVEEVQSLIPTIKEELRQELVFKEINQVRFNQNQLAKKLGKSPSTIKNYRKLGMPYYYNKAGSLEFNLGKVEKWLEENDK